MNVIVLNMDDNFLHMTSWQRALELVRRKKVTVVKWSDMVVSSFTEKFRIPKIIRLLTFVRHLYKKGVPLTKRNIFIRDDYSCCYCGVNVRGDPTIDHIIPKHRGGKMEWNNIVTACRECNGVKKRNRTPSEAGMSLRKKPNRPTIGEFLQLKIEALGIKQTIDDVLNGK